MRKIKGFTLIEILVVVTIISLLTSAAVVSYTQLGKQSRDARRKTDLEQIRAAIEMYRSNNNYYPATSGVVTTCASSDTIADASNTYLNDVSDDPKCPTYKYYYIALPNGCDNSVGSYCTNYIVAAHLETSPSVCQSLNTECTDTCTYCLNAYGSL